MKRLMVAAGAAALFAGCSSVPLPKIASGPAPVQANNDVPYLWTLGNAPQAHKDFVATFDRVGRKTGEYLWAKTIQADAETRVVIDRLTQMVYVYRGDDLVGVATISASRQGYITPLGEW